MDQNQTVDNDLQKAIDDITNTTSVDPVFSDPVAAPSSVPEGDTGELSDPVGPFPEPKVEPLPPAPNPVVSTNPMEMPQINPSEFPAAPAPMPVEPIPAAPAAQDLTPTEKLDTKQIKNAALRDLIPLLDHLNMDANQKFNIYRNIFEDLRDYTVLEPAYKAAREIPDETTRAEALLYLVESIDKM